MLHVQAAQLAARGIATAVLSAGENMHQTHHALRGHRAQLASAATRLLARSDRLKRASVQWIMHGLIAQLADWCN